MDESNKDRLRLRVLSLNVWGLKYVSKYRKERIKAIAEYICKKGDDTLSVSSQDSSFSAGYPEATSFASRSGGAPKQRNGNGHHSSSGHELSYYGSRWDVVCLQELWCREDWDYLQARCKESNSGLIHGRYFYSGALGSGLCVLSKYPIVATSTWPYSLNGSPLHVIEGDFYVAKACGQATLDLGKSIGLCTILNTHFFAPGGEWGDEWKRAHRLAQAWELARLANVAAERGQHVIVCGDLNSGPTTLTMNMLLSHSQLSDSWSFTHPPATAVLHTQNSTPMLSAMEAITYNGITCDNPLNTWSASKKFDDQVTRQRGKRLDYILFRNSGIPAWQGRPERLSNFKPVECNVVAHQERCKIIGKDKKISEVSLTDHFGVETVFEFANNASERSEEVPLVPARPAAREVLSLALAAITIYANHSATATKGQLFLFAMSLLGIPVLSVAACFQPLKYLNWIFVLLGIANGVGGATMLYTGFVGGRWEQSALRNVTKDMSTELDRLERLESQDSN